MENLSCRFARSERIEVSRVGERNVLYHRDTGKAMVLNPSGSWLWEQLSTPQTPGALSAALQNHFQGLTPEQASHDVETFLNELRKHEAVVADA